MVERICPACQTGNPIAAVQCARCGQGLREQLPARRKAALTPLRRQLQRGLRQAAQPVALGLAALALEIGAALLQRHQAAANSHQKTPATPQPASAQRPGVAIRQRVWEEYQAGELRRRVFEQIVIRREE